MSNDYTTAIVAMLPEAAARVDAAVAKEKARTATMLAQLVDAWNEKRASRKTPRGVTPAPVLADLPLITKGPWKGERWMDKRSFAGWCGVTVAAVDEWIYTQQIRVEKQGDQPQSRVRIASGERERRKPPIVSRRRRKEG